MNEIIVYLSQWYMEFRQWFDSWEGLENFYNFYKAAFFSASLTMGTFLFAMSTFIIQTMKKEVYDNPAYQEEVTARKKAGSKSTYYGPLNRLRWAIVISISISFIGAVAQLIAGAFPNKASILLGLFFLLASIGSMFLSLYLVSANISQMFKFAEKKLESANNPNSHQ